MIGSGAPSAVRRSSLVRFLVPAALALAAMAGAPQALAAASCVGAKGVLYYSASDGSVRGINVRTGAEVRMIPSSALTNTGTQHEIALDSAARTLWYSGPDGNLHSIDVDTFARGRDIAVADASPGAARHVVVDEVRRHVVTPLTNGSVQRYRVSDGSQAGTLRADRFQGANPGALRHLAFDPRTGTFWYAVTDGSLVELSGGGTPTGRTIPPGTLLGGNPGAFRHLAVDPVRNLLLYAVTDGSVAAIDLWTLQRASFLIRADAFVGANPGAFRTITYDPQDAGGRLSAPRRAVAHTEPFRRGVLDVMIRNSSKRPVGIVIDVVGKGFRLPDASLCLSPGRRALLRITLPPVRAGTYRGKVVLASTAAPRVKTIRLVRDVG